MGSTVTLSELKQRARERADQVNSTFVQDSELTSYINISAKQLYDLLVAAYGEDYYIKDAATPYTITADGTNDTFSLPTDFYKMVGLDEDAGGGQRYTLKPFMFQERNQYKQPYFALAPYTSSYKYKVFGDSIKFIPKPSANKNFYLWYIPVMTELVNGTDELDGINGWEEFIVLDVAIKMMIKEESDPSALIIERRLIKDNLEAMAQNRDSGMSMRVQDVRRDQISPYGGRGVWEI